MAPHAEPSPPPSPTTHKPLTPSSHFLSHISSIPLLADSRDLVGSYTPAFFTNTLSKAFEYIPSSVIHRADELGDAVLTQLEHTFPAVWTPTEEVLVRPRRWYERVFVRPVWVVGTTVETYKGAVWDGYKAYVEPKVGSYTDAYVKRVNDYFEGAVEAGMPKSYSEAVTEGESEREREIEVYRSVRILRNAVERGRVRFVVPVEKMVGKTMEDVRKGGKGIKKEIRGIPGNVGDGVVYVWKVLGEEVEREKGTGRVGVRGVVKVGYRVSERYVGEVVGVGLTVAAKSMGVVWGIWEAGREKVKMA